MAGVLVEVDVEAVEVKAEGENVVEQAEGQAGG